MAHHFILDVYDSPNRKYVNLSIIYYIVDFSFFMSQDDAYFHIYQNGPGADLIPPLQVVYRDQFSRRPCGATICAASVLL